MKIELVAYKRQMYDAVLSLISYNRPETCVLFAERFEKFYYAKCFVFLREKKLCGAFLVSKTGLLLFCLPYAANSEFQNEAAKLLKNFFSDSALGLSQIPRISCISGEKKGVLFLSSLCQQTQKGIFSDYTLMKHDGKTFAPPNPVFPPVIHCTEKKYFSALLPLRAEYEQVEVCAPANIDFDEQRCRAALLRLLLSHIVYALPFGSEQEADFAATAAVSAETAHFVQIAGVFTRSDFRNRGMARFLTQTIAREAFLRDKQAVLFVRKKNAPAVQAYTSSGFYAFAEYAITYFE